MARTGNFVDNSIYEAALEGLELQKQRIDEQINHVRALLAGKTKVEVSNLTEKTSTPKKKRKLSLIARKRIAEAQKKRWDAYRKEQGTAVS